MKVYRNERLRARILSTYDGLLKMWGCQTEETDIETPYGSTHIVACGDQAFEPLVLFHGVGDDSALMWVYNAREWSKYFRVYAVDTLGGPGKSVPGAGYNRNFDDVLWIDAVMDGFSLDSAFFAGVSHGGYLTQVYALRRPERVRKGVSISGAVPAGKNGNPMKTMLKIFLPEALIPTDGNVTRLMKKLCGSNYRVFTEEPMIMAHYKALLMGFNPAAMGFHRVEGFDAAEVDAIRDRITYLVGRADPFERLGGEQALKDNRMNAFFYDDAGHGLNHEMADEINRRLMEILTGK